ncbi:MAG: hypothetical protein H8E11_02545 [Candidatus Cloacimonetes bacterium]|nr:hypothetical protein [Candidatus Cloacimonadota bacterium]
MNNKHIPLLIFFVTANLFGQHGSNDFEVYMNYQKEPTTGNFIKTIEYYNEQLERNTKYTAHLMLANIFQKEFQKNMNILEEELDSLSTMNKFSYANLLLDIGQFEKSITIYDRLNENFPKSGCLVVRLS